MRIDEPINVSWREQRPVTGRLGGFNAAVQSAALSEGVHLTAYAGIDDGRIEIPPAPVKGMVDPTGCGDAYRGGLLYGLMNGLDWEVTGRIAALMGAIKIEHHGTQNHSFTMDEFRKRYRHSFDMDPEVI